MKSLTFYKNCFFYVLFLLSMSLLTTQAIASDKRIINGTTTTVSEYPWVVNLFVLSNAETGEGGSCGGSLIHPEWVLTAGHCFLNAEGNAVDLTTGSKTTVTINSTTLEPLEVNGIMVQSVKVIVHPLYNPDNNTSPNSSDYDIALLKLSQPINNITPVSVIDANSADINAGIITTIMGWGTTALSAEGQSINASNSLLKVDQKVVSNSECSKIYGDGIGITDNMLCANGFDASDTRDSCQGDSGGPLVMNDNGKFIQVGITSFGGTGIACGDPATPGVYTKVSRFKSFIEEQVSGVNFLTPSMSTVCTGAVLDSQLNVAIPCLIYNGIAYQTDLNIVKNLYWQWSGQIAPSACQINTSACTSLSSTFDLTIRQIQIEGQSYTAKLNFDTEFSDVENNVLFWNYSSHTVE